MKRLITRVKEIENINDKNDVYLTLYAILDDLACYSGCIYDALIDSTYRDSICKELENNRYMPYLKKLIRDNNCSNGDELLETLNIIKQTLMEKGLSEYELGYDVEATSTGSVIVSIAVFA